MNRPFLPDRWSELAPLLDAALDVEPSERPAFLDRACAGDAGLRVELEALLVECARTDRLFASGAVERFGALLAAPPGQIPEMLAGRYRVQREIGAGGMATVYLARDIKHDRDVALKVLRVDLSATIGTDRFLTEIQIAARLDHPHILTLIDSGSADGTLFYVMPYVRGESLRARLARERQLSVHDALSITRQIASALDYAHTQGVVHRDIKPENILLHEGEAVLADFGIALAVAEAGGTRLTQTGLSLGTPQYMSPEQASGERTIDARSDIYSLGAVLYEMLAGEPPVTGATRQAVIAKLLAERPTRLRIIRDTVPDGVDSAVFKALSKVPADRFNTAGAFIRALDAPPATNASAPSPARVNKRLRAAFGVSGVIVVLIIVAWLARGKTAEGGRVITTLTGRQQITSTGRVTIPAISGDGKVLAYRRTACGPNGCLYGIELQDVTGGPPHRLLDGAKSIYTIDWSPDRRNLLVVGNMGAGFGSYVVSVFGGTPRRLKHGASFFADGDSLLLGKSGTLDGDPRIELISDLNGVVHDSIRVGDPGDQVAFALQIPGSNRIVIGMHRKVSTSLAAPLEAFVLRRDGRVLSQSVIGIRGSRNTEAHVSADALWISPGGEGWPKRAVLRVAIDPVSGLFANAIDTINTAVHTRFGVTTDGSSLVLDEGSTEYSLWALDVAHAVRGEFPQDPLLRSTSQLNVRMSPDGKRILVGRDVGRPADGRPGWSTIPFDGPPNAETSLPLGERTTEAFWSDDATVAIRARTNSGASLALVDVTSGVLRESMSSDRPRTFARLPSGGWIWVRGIRPELSLQRLGDSAPRRILVPKWYADVYSAALSQDERLVAFAGHNAPRLDSVGVSVMSLADQSVRRWFTVAGDDGDLDWLSDGTLLLRLAETPETYSLYHLTQPDRAVKLGIIPRTVSSISVAADLKRAAIVVHDYRGDAWINRVVRPKH
jgi:predicted RNase H-related nuclease YkuK (DUF458 family)